MAEIKVAELKAAELKVTDLKKSYATRGEPLSVLKGVTFQLSRGENLAILGPSGSGKSTLLQIIGTLDTPTAGEVLIEDQNPFTLAEPQLAEFRNQKIGFIFQDHHLLPQCSVLENVLLPTVASGRTSQQAIDRAHSLLERVGLSQRLTHLPSELSGGERQRVAVARSLIHHPTLLLADEPTGNLDHANAQGIGQLLLDLQQEENNILVVVTHSQELAETLQRRGDINDGQLSM